MDKCSFLHRAVIKFWVTCCFDQSSHSWQTCCFVSELRIPTTGKFALNIKVPSSILSRYGLRPLMTALLVCGCLPYKTIHLQIHIWLETVTFGRFLFQGILWVLLLERVVKPSKEYRQKPEQEYSLIWVSLFCKQVRKTDMHIIFWTTALLNEDWLPKSFNFGTASSYMEKHLHGWQILATQPWPPCQGKQAPVTLIRQWRKEGGGEPLRSQHAGNLQKLPPSKTQCYAQTCLSLESTWAHVRIVV